MTARHPWSRYVAIGDSFTEGIGDPEPDSPGGHRGWADRVAEVLAAQTPAFAYANLAVRGRLLQQILDEQVDAALALRPDLISISAGGNDIIRPGTDPDEVAARLDSGVQRLRSDGATVVMFNGPDIGGTPVLGRIRGKVAIYNENLHAVAKRHDAVVADMWALRELTDPRMWAPDRLALLADRTSDDRRHGARRAQRRPRPRAVRSRARCRNSRWRQARIDDVAWAREYFGPWILRRIRHQSSGDGVQPKRPTY